MKRFIYFFYFFKSTDWKKLKKQLAYTSEKYSCSKSHLILDMLFCSLKHGFSFHEFFYYKLCNKTTNLRKEYASMTYMYEYEKKFNSCHYINYLDDKLAFNSRYSEYVNRKWADINLASLQDIEAVMSGSEKIVLKRSKGTIGKDVLILDSTDKTPNWLLDFATKNKYNLVEEFVLQHSDLHSLSPNSLNTIRIITQLNEDNNVDILAAILRMGTFKNTDNFSTGGIAAKVDVSNGIVVSNGVVVDISEPEYTHHPVSGMQIKGFQIPHWDMVLTMTSEAAKVIPFNRTVGWDIAIKQDEPILIEGNQNWWAGIWQMVEDKGMKSVLDKYNEK